MLIIEVFCKLRNTFGIRLSLEFEPLSCQKGLEFLVVGYYAIMDDGELPCWVGSRLMR